MLTEIEVENIINRRSRGEISFLEFLDELLQKGISEYDIDVATGEAIYKGGGSEFRTGSQVTLTISKEFDKQKVREAIANINLSFIDFLKELGEVGVSTYRVNIRERKVIYIGINGERVEEAIK